MAEKDIGFVYILKNEAMPGIYKIGVTGRDGLDTRIDELLFLRNRKLEADNR